MTVHFIGAGPGAPDLITLRAQQLIASAPVCLYAGSLVPAEVLAHCPPGARLIDTAGLNLDQIVAELVGAHSARHDVARLCSGDPSVFSALAEQTRRLDAAGVPWDVTPGVPAFAAAAAALGRELTVPGVSQTVVLSRIAHQATPMPAGEDLASLGALGATLVLHLAVQRIEHVVTELEPHYGPSCPVAVVACASRPDEVVLRGTLADIAGQVVVAGVGRTAVIIVGRVLAAEGFCDSHLYSPDRDRGTHLSRPVAPGPVATSPIAPTIRAARPTDTGPISSLVGIAYGHYVERMGREPAPMLDDYAALIAGGDVWAAEDSDGTLVGALVLRTEPDHLLLATVAVDPRRQSRGLGAALLAFTEDCARKRGLPEVRLYTHVTMIENIGYYARRGYTETHRGGQAGFERVFFSKRVAQARSRRSR